MVQRVLLISDDLSIVEHSLIYFFMQQGIVCEHVGTHWEYVLNIPEQFGTIWNQHTTWYFIISEKQAPIS